jgi:hypothetical protein
MATRCARLHHLDLTTYPRTGVLDRYTRSRIPRPNRLEQVKNVLRAQRRPKSQKMMIRISQTPTATKRDESRVSNLRQDHGRTTLSRDEPHLQP